ncbi:MAG: hypothetical protein RL220_1497 [Bacteroidota bacterium]
MEETPLTNFNNEITDTDKIKDAVFFSVIFLAIIWAIFLMDDVLGYHLKSHGLRPRSVEGLKGIFTIHFLHGDLKHIAQNSLAFLVLNSFLFYFYRPIALKVFLFLFFLPGMVLWLWARPDNHIGASMLIFGEAAFLFTSGIIRKDGRMMRVSLVVALYYGSLIWYVFPIDPTISWEGHLSGLLTGVVLALWLRNQGPQRIPFQWELEPDEDELVADVPSDEQAVPVGSQDSTAHANRVVVHYEYVEKKPDTAKKPLSGSDSEKTERVEP